MVQQSHVVPLNAGPADAVKHLGPDIAGVLGGKGGGRPGMYSGKATLLQRRQEAAELLHMQQNGYQSEYERVAESGHGSSSAIN